MREEIVGPAYSHSKMTAAKGWQDHKRGIK